MVTLGRGQFEDKELDGWGVSWWRDQQAPKWGQMWQVPEHKRKPRYGGGNQMGDPGRAHGLF